MSLPILASILSTALAAAPHLADDLPPGSEVALRVAVGDLGPEVKAALADLRPLAAAWPPLESALAAADGLAGGPWSEPLRRCGVELATRGATLTVVADVEGEGGGVVGAILRGVSPRAPAPAPGELEERSVDGERAFLVTGRDVAFAPSKGQLVIGTERGVQRLLRHLRAPRTARGAKLPTDPLARLAAGVRRDAPVALVVTLSPAVREVLTSTAAPLGVLLAPVSALTGLADAKGIDLALAVENAKQREAVAGGVRALFAALNAAGQGLLALGELAGSVPQLAPETPLLPKGLDPKLFGPTVTAWLRDFRLTPAVHVRPGGVEAHADVTGWRGLAAAALVLRATWPASRGAPAVAGAGAGKGAAAVERARAALARAAGRPAAEGEPADPELRDEAEALLVDLRDAELAYKREHGRFLACGPVPKALPAEPEAWRPDGCFSELGFEPDADETLLQLEARLEGGHLVLLARADPDGDGVPVVWVLDETAAAVRTVAAAADQR